jgi:two-component system, NtrC family, response regulator HydG
VELAIPPLRDRPEDLRELAAVILARVASRLKRPIANYSSDALRHLLRYAWPGNVRQLENAIEHACALAPGSIVEATDLPPEIRNHHSLAADPVGVRPLREVEREYILAALERNAGNRTLTAQQLGIAMATLYRKLRRYALDR